MSLLELPVDVWVVTLWWDGSEESRTVCSDRDTARGYLMDYMARNWHRAERRVSLPQPPAGFRGQVEAFFDAEGMGHGPNSWSVDHGTCCGAHMAAQPLITPARLAAMARND